MTPALTCVMVRPRSKHQRSGAPQSALTHCLYEGFAIMKLKISAAALATFAGLTAALTTVPAAAMTPAGEEAMTKAGLVMFEHRCRSCHADDQAKQSYGPSLVGIVGRKAGTREGFAYSDAMKASGIVWTEDALRNWIADNTGVMPGTRMKHMAITDKTEQDFILSYLKSLK
jgi:cytochrome c